MAIAIVDRPQLAQRARELPLPEGLDVLLAVAAGEDGTISSLTKCTGVSRLRLRMASSFYIEQVLLSESSDSYRVLGLKHDSTREQLRRHMALLMRWLHPDSANALESVDGLDRRVFASRVARAWQDLKSDDRRAVYDAVLAKRSRHAPQARLRIVRQPYGNRSSSHAVQQTPYLNGLANSASQEFGKGRLSGILASIRSWYSSYKKPR